MANRIVFQYPQMESVATKINSYAAEYEQAAQAFLSEMQAATASWEGESKDKFMALVEDSVFNYMHVSVPQMVQGLGDLLKANIQTMQETDAEIAKNIPPSI